MRRYTLHRRLEGFVPGQLVAHRRYGWEGRVSPVCAVAGGRAMVLWSGIWEGRETASVWALSELVAR